MIETIFKLSKSEEKLIEKVIHDENIHYNHMILNKNEGLPLHSTNSNVYMTVAKGRLSIKLGDQEPHEYEEGTILKLPIDIEMDAKNLWDEQLELIVVKAPAPTK